jgi:hypothetical protein
VATTHVYKDVKLYSGAYDLTGASNSLTLGYEFEEKDATVFNDNVRHSMPGLAKVSFDFAGFGYSDGTDEVEDVLYARTTTTSVPMTFCPTGDGAAASIAYFAETLELSQSYGGAIGEMYPFSAKGVGQGSPLVRGTILENAAKTTTGAGTARLLGAVTATQKLYGCLHVTAVSGTNPTLDVIVESDDAAGFSSGTTRLTFTQKTAVGSQFITPVAGPITDTYWRASVTIGGTDTPSFTIVLTVGIQ